MTIHLFTNDAYLFEIIENASEVADEAIASAKAHFHDVAHHEVLIFVPSDASCTPAARKSRADLRFSGSAPVMKITTDHYINLDDGETYVLPADITDELTLPGGNVLGSFYRAVELGNLLDDDTDEDEDEDEDDNLDEED